MANKKIIAAALVCAVTALSAGVITSVGAVSKQEVSDSGKTVSAAVTSTNSETKQEQQSGTNTVSKKVTDISEDLSESDLELTDEQEKKLDELISQQEEIINAHKELWDKVYEAENEEMLKFIDENLTAVPDGKDVINSLTPLDEDADDIQTYVWNGDSYVAEDGSTFTLGDDFDEAGADEDVKFQHYAVTLDGDTGEEKTYVWNGDGYDENGEVFMLPSDWNGTDDKLWEKNIINNMEDLTDDEKALLLDDLQKIYEINDQIAAVYQEAESI